MNTQEELRELLRETKTFNYNVYFGVGGGDNAISYDEALDEIIALIKSRESALLNRGFRDGLIWVQQDILEKVSKGKYKLQGKGVESGAFIVRDDITLKLAKLDQLSKGL